MNEITRIHLAKVAYDIDIAAKKQLQSYIKELESYNTDSEVLTDVEIRMTELLAERNVAAGGVITNEDVSAIRAQLGEPYEFSEEAGDIAVGPIETEPHQRRFYRDLHGAMLGGVLSGIALYLKVDALWVRIAFIILLFVSFGLAFFGYVVLWIVVPPAHTATQRLHQEGRLVTLQAIRDIKERTSKLLPSTMAPMVQRGLCVMLGLLSALGAIGVAAVLALGIAQIVFGNADFNIGSEYTESWIGATLIGLAIFGLALLIALLSLVAYSFFTQKLTKRMVVSGIVIIVLGLVSFATVLGTTSMQTWQVRNNAERMVQSTEKQLPQQFSGVKSLTIKTSKQGLRMVPIEYIVSDKSSYTLTALPDTKVTVEVKDGAATLTIKPTDSYLNNLVQSGLVVYGPALSELTVEGMNVSYAGTTQTADLMITNKKYGSVTINEGVFGKVSVAGAGAIDVSAATVNELIVNGSYGIEVDAGTIHTLAVTLPDACPRGDNVDINVNVASVTQGAYTFNGTEYKTTHKTGCAQVMIGDDEANY